MLTQALIQLPTSTNTLIHTHTCSQRWLNRDTVQNLVLTLHLRVSLVTVKFTILMNICWLNALMPQKGMPASRIVSVKTQQSQRVWQLDFHLCNPISSRCVCRYVSFSAMQKYLVALWKCNDFSFFCTRFFFTDHLGWIWSWKKGVV